MAQACYANRGQACSRACRPAVQGHAPAQASLAALYDDGLGVPKNKAEAMKWYCRAADGGDPIAQDYIASLPGSWDELCMN